MFIVGFCIHIVFLYSIFDIYFKSPIVKNVVPYQPQHEAVADRFVLFMVDGLRAESFVNYTTMPYLRSIANTKGRWGISNTQVPTESRPGHVAVIAGFYEDPSAIMKGWKENPVDFDSVFNRSSSTWCWGTYDIVEIFTKGTVDNHIVVHKYDPYDSTFATDKNTTLLDSWVFENVKDFFYQAKTTAAMREKLKQKKIVFFLHLLGTDTSGHKHKPKTQNFLTTVKFVDQGIKEIEQIIRDFYNDDGKTTFLMTSDHGMTDWGSHGSGDDHETQTPFVLWGAGVQQSKAGPFDPETEHMSLNHRFDIKQADLAPLMSTILSIPVPVNSIGRLPADLLNMTIPNRAKAIYSHSRQLASQYNKKKMDVEANAIAFLYKPFEPFSTQKFREMIDFTEKLLADKEYEKLIHFSEEITQLSLAGLTYYQNYYQLPLLIHVTFSFLGWILYLLKMLLEHKLNAQLEPTKSNKFKILRSHAVSNMGFLLLCLVYFYFVFAQRLPIQYYVHFLMPIILWWCALPSRNQCSRALRLFKRSRKINTIWLEVLCYGLGSMALGLSFTYRWMLSIPLIGMGLWPFLSSIRNRLTTPILIAWPSSCAMLSFFSFIPVVGKDVFIELVVLAGLLWLIMVTCYTWKVLLPLYYKQEENKTELVLTVIQAVLLIVSLHNIYVQSNRFEDGTQVSYFYQALTWTTAVLTLALPMASSKRLICRLMTINTSIVIFYLLLSVAHEGLFLVTLNFNIMCWVFMEFRLLYLGRIKDQPLASSAGLMERTVAESAYDLVSPSPPTKSAHVLVGPSALTKSAHVLVGRSAPTKSAHVLVGPSATTKSAHVLVGPSAPTKSAHVLVGRSAPTKSAHVLVGPSAPIKSAHHLVGPSAPTIPLSLEEDLPQPLASSAGLMERAVAESAHDSVKPSAQTILLSPEEDPPQLGELTGVKKPQNECLFCCKFKKKSGTKRQYKECSDKIFECTFEKNPTDAKAKNTITNIERSISSEDFRRAFFFLTYIILAFFGTGNIASLNSFEVRWVTCFITSFQPFIITGLILLKTLSPFLSVGCSFRGVQCLTEAPTGYLNVIVLIYSNIMGIQLLYYVKNIGSWLEIGTSISQFVIVQVITLFIVVINQISKIMTDFNIFNAVNNLLNSRKKYV